MIARAAGLDLTLRVDALLVEPFRSLDRAVFESLGLEEDVHTAGQELGSRHRDAFEASDAICVFFSEDYHVFGGLMVSMPLPFFRFAPGARAPPQKRFSPSGPSVPPDLMGPEGGPFAGRPLALSLNRQTGSEASRRPTLR